MPGGGEGVGKGEPAGHIEGVDRGVVNYDLGDPVVFLDHIDGHRAAGLLGRVGGS